MRKNKGITLIVLVITIIILLILAGVTIAMLTGENGLLTKTEKAKEEHQRETATEVMNLKITNIQMSSQIDNGEVASLQYLADELCKDDDIQYVELTSKKLASLPPVTIEENNKSIFVKLKEYPYEFEINSLLKVASINEAKIENNETENNQEER